MQTTLRLNDKIFRQAKTEAASEGMTLTQFIEEALAMRVRQGKQKEIERSPIKLPTFDSGHKITSSFDLMSEIHKADDAWDDRTKKQIGIGNGTKKKMR